MEKEMLEKMIQIEKMSLDQISRFNGTPKSTVAWYVKKFGLQPAKKYLPLKEEELREFYINQKLSAKQTAKKLGVWEKSVLFWLEKYEIPIRPVGTNQYSHLPKQEKIKPPKKSRRIKIETVLELVKSKDCQFLDMAYINNRARIFYTCRCGFDHSMLLSNFRRGYSCSECKRRAFKGEKNHNFNPNLTEEDRLELGRYEEGYKAWRRKIFRKYGFSCDTCGCSESGKLNAHHLNSYANNPELRLKVENGVCLCEMCHVNFHKANGFGNNTEQQYQDFRRDYVSKNLRP